MPKLRLVCSDTPRQFRDPSQHRICWRAHQTRTVLLVSPAACRQLLKIGIGQKLLQSDDRPLRGRIRAPGVLPIRLHGPDQAFRSVLSLAGRGGFAKFLNRFGHRHARFDGLEVGATRQYRD